LPCRRSSSSATPPPQYRWWVCHRARWYRLDFAFVEVRLALEYDGDGHEHTREQDADRDLAMKELQIDTIRVTKSMMRDPDDLRRRILKVHADRSRLGLDPLIPQTPPWL
jgi:very-short-patch-repair endonuclease